MHVYLTKKNNLSGGVARSSSFFRSDI